jgi:lysozyme
MTIPPSIREKASALLRHHEGTRLKPYLCPGGYWTLGVGRNIEARWQSPADFPDGISLTTAQQWLDEDIDTACTDLDAWLPSWRTLTDERQAALIDIAFNLGRAKLFTFVKAQAALAMKDYHSAAEELLMSKWALQVKGRAKRLAAIIETGFWPKGI